MNNFEALAHLVRTAASPKTVTTIEIWELDALIKTIKIAKKKIGLTCQNGKHEDCLDCEFSRALMELEDDNKL